MKKQLLLLILLIVVHCAHQRSQAVDYPIVPVSIKDVVITDHFWLPKIKVIQDTTIHYAFDKCAEEGRMQNFLVAGGKAEGPVCGKMPFDDTDLYKIIEGASYSLISQPNPELDAYLDSLISIIKIGQEPDGYLTTWRTINPKKPPAPWVHVKEGRRWESLEASHELYNAGHMYEAAYAHYRATGKTNFLDIAYKNADLIVKTFGDGEGQIAAVPGHQIIETGLIKLYEASGKKDYLKTAKYFLDNRGRPEHHKLGGDYSQDHMPVIEQKDAVGHAVRALYMYAGMTDIAAIYKDADYLNAVHALWGNATNKKMYLTGGMGARHEGEAFGDDYELPNLTAYNETCAAIANVYWNHRLFLLSGDSKYMDILERTLYNGLIAGISLDGKKFFYPNPLESDGKYPFNQGFCTRAPWFDCSCCPTNMIRFLPSVPGLIYATREDTLFVNLYISDAATVDVNGEKIQISQKSDYPWDGHIALTFQPKKAEQFTVKLRIPGWARNEAVPGDLYAYKNAVPKDILLSINGQETPVILKKGYAEITRKWQPGDQVELVLPMDVHEVAANEKVKDDHNKAAFEYGPMVFCAEEIDNPKIGQLSIPEDVTLQPKKQKILTEDVVTLQGTADGQDMTLIPYYLWSNRGVGKMEVWLPEED